ncbi:hypothetical protein FACS1894105_08170 [Clostridia bacterium]|nr:hypothetical protein FACS1894105_08170 [Clostridia bacterium]
MNTENFTGRAQSYTKARPSYPAEAIEYIRGIVPPDAIFADVGAGTGKFTELLARYGYKIFAVEPNADMREQLAVTLASFPKVKIVCGTAESTTLPDNSADVITSAQALNWFNTDAFRAECCRIGKADSVVITVFNYDSNYKHNGAHGVSGYDKSTVALYRNPVIREFQNPVYFTRDNWILYFSSMAGVPKETEPGYVAHIADINERFDRDNSNGLLRLDLVTKVYCEKLERIVIPINRDE